MSMNGRENLLNMYSGKETLFLPGLRDEYPVIGPGERCREPEGGLDFFGVHWTYFDFMDQTPTPGRHILENITEWREVVKFPDLDTFDWESDARMQLKDFDPDNQFLSAIVFNGHFERLHALMGFENACMAFYLEPEALKEFFNALTEHKLKYLECMKKYYNPDLVGVHDDWGNNTNMFFSPDLWREFIKPEVEKVIIRTHELGMFYEQHSCGMVQPIIGDLVELGSDSIHPLQAPMNNVAEVKKEFGSRLIIRGGVDTQLVNSPVSTEDEVREHIRGWLETCTPGGKFIPQVMVRGRLREIVDEELAHYKT